MPTIIDIDEFVGDEHLVFRYQGRDYIVPGDPPLPILFQILRLHTAITSGQPVEEQVAAFEQLHVVLLEFFRLQTPEMATLPFGRIGVSIVTRSLLQVYGLVVVEEQADPPTEPAAKTTTKKASGGRRKTSRSSSGSQSS